MPSLSDFHLAIAAAGGNRALLVALKALRMNLENLFDPHNPQGGQDVVAWHEEILGAIERRDAERAGRLMEEHAPEGAQRAPASAGTLWPWGADCGAGTGRDLAVPDNCLILTSQA